MAAWNEAERPTPNAMVCAASVIRREANELGALADAGATLRTMDADALRRERMLVDALRGAARWLEHEAHAMPSAPFSPATDPAAGQMNPQSRRVRA